MLSDFYKHYKGSEFYPLTSVRLLTLVRGSELCVTHVVRAFKQAHGGPSFYMLISPSFIWGRESEFLSVVILSEFWQEAWGPSFNPHSSVRPCDTLMVRVSWPTSLSEF
ncbi:hypothetical protein HanOQP8_Chr14g0510251 [Helianthus annuus]|nr:hypothetical protein HanOQP8_Chr14g0510251 [Helianthus annuus]